MDTCSNDTDIISELWCLQSRFLESLNSGVSAYKAIGDQLKATFDRARQCLVQSHAPAALAQAMAIVARTCLTYTQLEEDSIAMEENLATSINDVFTRGGLRRRRKRANRSHKSKAGKNGHVRKSGKKSKRGRKSPVGNPRRRAETSKSGSKKSSIQDINGKKSRNVTAPPTDSMKFGPCRDFFLAHLGDPYPTTVQKHQILKQSSPDFTLRSLNLWFVNIRRRSKWMDIFKKHAGSKRDAMRDLVARVEAQVAGRPAPNPLPSGAAPPGCRVDQGIVEEVMAMRAVVDMVSREVYGEGWDQILQIRPWTDEEVRAHEERKKATRRQARESKVDGEKRKREREEQKLQRQRDRDHRKRIEQEAVEGIRAARELHAKLMAMNKRKRDDEGGSEGSLKRRRSKDTDLDETIESKKGKIKVPKFDDMGNPLTKEQRKAIKRAMIAAQAEANPLKRKSPELHDSTRTDGLPDTSPSKRRRRDAVTFDGFPAAGAATETEGMTDLTQLFSLEWASPQAQSAQLPSANQDPVPTAPQPGYGGFALPSDSQPASVPANETPAPEVPRRFSQQLAAFALESGMFDNQNFELFTADTFPGMEVDMHAGSGTQDMSDNNTFGTGMHNAVNDFGVNAQPPTLRLNTNASATGSMSVSPTQSQLHTPMQQFATPTQHHVTPFEFTQPNDHSHSMHGPSSFGPSNDSSQHSNADSSDMSWINAALEQLPSQHDVARMNNTPQFSGQANEFGSQVHYPPQYNTQHAPEYDQRPSTTVSDWHEPVQRMSQLQQNTQTSQSRPSYPPSATSTPMPPPQARPLFSQPQSKPTPQTPAKPSTSQPPQRHRAPGSLWQTPHSQPSQPRYATPGPSTYTQPPVSFSAPHPPHSYPSPATPQYSQPQAYTPVQYEERPQERRSDVAPDNASYNQRYQPEQPMYQGPPQSPPTPQVSAKNLIKEREAEFARAQEVLQAQFRKEQEEQLARFMRAQEDLRNQILGSSSGSRSS
ncbi:Microtubule-associated protein 1B [Rhizoctonia solani]|uniref:Microtubule-associated protein 1B n=1 Tax=Rhizoctonia solani TaxID=456999 RepID=A0A0K6GFB2_9AGAM|nr:Microtubule-associated protein 1B [Rhizoctonia solani]